MWEKFKHWLLHKLTPHCPQCHEQELEAKTCTSCETLKSMLDAASSEKRQLLAIISELTSKKEEPTPQEEPAERRPLKHRPLTWRAQRQILESESRQRAMRERDAKDKIIKDGVVPKVADVAVKSVSDLETEMGVTHDA